MKLTLELDLSYLMVDSLYSLTLRTDPWLFKLSLLLTDDLSLSDFIGKSESLIISKIFKSVYYYFSCGYYQENYFGTHKLLVLGDSPKGGVVGLLIKSLNCKFIVDNLLSLG